MRWTDVDLTGATVTIRSTRIAKATPPPRLLPGSR